MGQSIARNIIRFIIIVLIQVLIMDHIMINGYLNPYFYIIFILLMPFESPRWLLLLAGFILGLSIDLFSNTLGMHTAASVFMAFMRPSVLKIFSPRDGYEPESKPRISYLGFSWFLKYTLLLTFLHHMVLFYVEVFNFQEFFSTFLRILLSTLLSSLTILLSQYFIFRK